MIWLIGGGLLLLCFISALVMPWINHSRVNSLRDEVDGLKHKLYVLEHGGASTLKDMAKSMASAPPQAPPAASSAVEPKETAPQKWQAPTVEHQPKEQPPKPDSSVKKKPGFEQQFGARLPVWIGGVAMALAGFFLVKYSIDNNLLSPAVRITFGAIFGIGLLYAAKKVRGAPGFANGERIGQSLAGAGIAVLYLVSFAASRLYGLVPVWAGFVAMAAVTAAALNLSLRHGPAIALIGLAGGFLTPALLSTGGGNAFALFTYLYFTASGLLIVVRKTSWWWLSIPTIAASLLWVVIWLATSYHPGDSIWLCLFLAGISATIILTSRSQYEVDGGGTIEGSFKLTSILQYLGLGGTLVLMGVVASSAGFGFMEWGLFGLITAAGIGLAYFNDKLYGFVPWVSMAVTAVMLFSWNTPDHTAFAIILAIFAALHGLAGYFLMFRSHSPLRWAGITAGASLIYYLLAYYKLCETTLLDGLPVFWGGLALILACEAVYAVQKIRTTTWPMPSQMLQAIFATTATAFIALGLFIELPREFLSVAIAVEMLAVAWIGSKIAVPVLRYVAAVLAGVFAILLLPQILLVVQLTAYSLVEAKLQLQAGVPIVDWPIFQLGVPAAMFVGAAIILRKQQDGKMIRIFEIAAIILVAVMGYYVTRSILHPDENILFIKAGFFERGILTNTLFLYGLLCLWIGRRYLRSAVSWSGVVLCAVALFRIIYFDMLIYNPLWASQKIGGVLLLNSLLLPYGLPLLWAYRFRTELEQLGRSKWANYVGGFMLASIFALISLNIRHMFHGEMLSAGITSNAEIYSYSAAWLLLGVGLLFGGIAKQSKALRYASLGVILFTVGKVFLYDASELEGLYRVFSFFGLGLVLIGLSYFYTRFVFGGDRDE